MSFSNSQSLFYFQHMHTQTHTHSHTCVCMHGHSHTQIVTYMCTCTCTHTRTHINTVIHVCVRTYAHTQSHMCVQTRALKCAHMRMHACTHFQNLDSPSERTHTICLSETGLCHHENVSSFIDFPANGIISLSFMTEQKCSVCTSFSLSIHLVRGI